jgi:hypothetical protein
VPIRWRLLFLALCWSINNKSLVKTIFFLCSFRAVLEVQQKASLKTALLEAKLKNLESRDLGPREIHVSIIIITAALINNTNI